MKDIIYFALMNVMFVLSIVMLAHQITTPPPSSHVIEMVDLFPIVTCILSFKFIHGLSKSINFY
jgi:hypothetical protein